MRIISKRMERGNKGSHELRWYDWRGRGIGWYSDHKIYQSCDMGIQAPVAKEN